MVVAFVVRMPNWVDKSTIHARFIVRQVIGFVDTAIGTIPPGRTVGESCSNGTDQRGHHERPELAVLKDLDIADHLSVVPLQSQKPLAGESRPPRSPAK